MSFFDSYLALHRAGVTILISDIEDPARELADAARAYSAHMIEQELYRRMGTPGLIEELRGLAPELVAPAKCAGDGVQSVDPIGSLERQLVLEDAADRVAKRLRDRMGAGSG